MAAVAVLGRTGLDPGRAGAAATGWPAACVLGGAMIVAAGVAAARDGHRWPVMGSRYERGTVSPPPAEPGAGSGPLAAAGHTRPHDPSEQQLEATQLNPRAAWDALDRGDDPTVR